MEPDFQKEILSALSAISGIESRLIDAFPTRFRAIHSIAQIRVSSETTSVDLTAIRQTLASLPKIGEPYSSGDSFLTYRRGVTFVDGYAASDLVQITI